MHELSIASELWRMCEERRQRARAGPVRHVRVAVGELASLEPELLAHAWEAVVGEGGARLTIDWHPARQTCASCGDVAERQPGSWLRLCPVCWTPLRVVGGSELDLVEIEFVGTPSEEPSACRTSS